MPRMRIMDRARRNAVQVRKNYAAMFLLLLALSIFPRVASGSRHRSRFHIQAREMLDVVLAPPASLPPGDPTGPAPSGTLPAPPVPDGSPPPPPPPPPPLPPPLFPPFAVLTPPEAPPPPIETAFPPIEIPASPPIETPAAPPSESPPPPPPPPPPMIANPGSTWNESEKAGVVIASIAALLQVAVVAFLLIKRHQMLTTVDYDDIDDLEYDNPRDPNYRHTESV